MHLIQRNNCPITGENELELLYSFKNFPIFMGCVDSDPRLDLTSNMDWYINKNTGVIQLNPLVPLEILYGKSHGSGTVGSLWDLHHKKFAEFISKFNLKNLLEIGSGHGKMIHNYLQLQPDSKWLVVEPNPIIDKDERIDIRQSLFNEEFDLDKNVEAIVHSHVIEHLYNPIELLKNINKKTNDQIVHLFSIPNLEIMLERNYTNALNFEHTLFLNEKCIDYILQETGFEIIEKKYFLDDHSIFYATKKSKIKRDSIKLNEYDLNKKLYNNYINYHLELVKDLNKKMEETSNEIFLFGAHVFSQFLLNFGLDENRITCVLDNDLKKQKKRLSGTNLLVESPAILRGKKNTSIILRSGVYNNEIREDIINNINSNIAFWE